MTSETRYPPFDPELQPVIEAMRSVYPPLTAENLGEQRAMFAAEESDAALDLTVGGLVDVDDLRVPGPAGEPDITLLVLRPSGGAAPAPAIYFVHGGGMVVGDRRTNIDLFVRFAAEGKAVIVSVEYRLAPEHPDPAPVEDCYAGLKWTAEHAEALGIDPSRLMIAGVSAGGGLAAGTALLARDRSFPELSHQVLICPMLDDRCVTPSSHMLDGEGIWDRNDNHFGWTALLGDRRGTDDVSYYAAPARCEDLSRLPRTYIDTGSSETFRDEILIHALRLSQAGVSVDLHMWGGGHHAFDLLAPQAVLSRAAIAARDAFIHRALSP